MKPIRDPVCQSLSERRELRICPPLRGASRPELTIYRSKLPSMELRHLAEEIKTNKSLHKQADTNHRI